jgi:hypothetical protein
MNCWYSPGKHHNQIPKRQIPNSNGEIPKSCQKEVIPQPAGGSIWNLGFEYWDFSKFIIKSKIKKNEQHP